MSSAGFTSFMVSSYLLTRNHPDWIRDALRLSLGELRLFWNTLAAVTLHPATFASDWADGRRRALNPIAFLATSLAITVPISQLFSRFLLKDPLVNRLGELGQEVAPYVLVAIWGGFNHLLIRAAGSNRPLRTTLGSTVYALFGPLAIADLVVTAFMASFRIPVRTHRAAMLIPELAVTGFYLSRITTGVHQLRWGWGMLAAVVPIFGVLIILITGVMVALIVGVGVLVVRKVGVFPLLIASAVLAAILLLGLLVARDRRSAT